MPYFRLRGEQICDDCEYLPLMSVSYAYQYSHDLNTTATTQGSNVNPLFKSLVSLNILKCSQYPCM